MKRKPLHSSVSGEQPKKKGRLFLPLFLGGIMVLSTFAILFSGPSNQDSSTSYKYGSTYYRLTSRGWEATVAGQQLLLRSGPKELVAFYSDLPLESITSLKDADKFYLSTSPDQPLQLAIRELYANENILPAFSLSCLKDDVKGCEQLPIKTCQQASDKIGVLILQLGETTSFTAENHCYTATGKTADELTQIVDKLLLYLYGVLP